MNVDVISPPALGPSMKPLVSHETRSVLMSLPVSRAPTEVAIQPAARHIGPSWPTSVSKNPRRNSCSRGPTWTETLSGWMLPCGWPLSSWYRPAPVPCAWPGPAWHCGRRGRSRRRRDSRRRGGRSTRGRGGGRSGRRRGGQRGRILAVRRRHRRGARHDQGQDQGSAERTLNECAGQRDGIGPPTRTYKCTRCRGDQRNTSSSALLHGAEDSNRCTAWRKAPTRSR